MLQSTATAKLMVSNGVGRFPGLDQYGFNYAFSTRVIGNVSNNWGPEQKAEENACRFYQRAGFGPDRVHLYPEHGTEIVRVGKESRGHSVRGDGLLTTIPELTLSLYSADCLPIVITAKQQSGNDRFVALVHAGWSGTEQQILEKAIRFIERTFSGLKPEQLMVLIGPGLQSCCYYDHELSQYLPSDPRWRPFIKGDSIDLVGYNIQQAMGAGVQRQNFVVANECTCCASDNNNHPLFFSHYRSKITEEREGRFAAAVALL